jgi:dihydropteroate synthase
MLKLEDLAVLCADYREAIQARIAHIELGGKIFDFNARSYVMGVINLSPDSWYRESVCLTTEQAIQRGKVLHAQGADLVDVGAESTLAQAARAESSSQAARLLPVVEGLRAAGVLVSVETYDLKVTRRCLAAGANVLNWTGTEQPERFFEQAAEFGAAVIVCYVQGKNVREVADFDFTADPLSLMESYFERQIKVAEKIGLKKLVIDPGLGFYYRNLQDSATRVRHQMKVFLNTFRLRKLGCPVCHALPHAFDYFGGEVRCAEPFFAVLAALGKTDLFRTHEVPRVKAVLDTLRCY